MNVSHLMNRTFDPKVNRYQGDGSGRDTYVTNSNGGFIADCGLPSNSPWTGAHIGGGPPQFYTNRSKVRPNAHKDAVAFRYFADGSGRDSYVASDNGGLIPKYKSGGCMQEFTNSLRQPEAPRYVGSIAQ